MNTDRQEKSIKQLFIGKCWEYLNENFHKFTETNKIKIALTLATKDIPQEVSGLAQQVVVMNEIRKGDQPLRFKIGETNGTADAS